MNELAKSKAANVLVWLAFGAFWLHSLHCCHTSQCAHFHTEARCERFLHHLSHVDVKFIFWDATDFSVRLDSSASRLAGSKNALLPSVCARGAVSSERFGRCSVVRVEKPSDKSHYHAKKSKRDGICLLSRSQLNQEKSRPLVAAPTRSFLDDVAPDACADAFRSLSSRFTDAAAPPLYLRLRKLLN